MVKVVEWIVAIVLSVLWLFGIYSPTIMPLIVAISLSSLIILLMFRSLYTNLPPHDSLVLGEVLERIAIMLIGSLGLTLILNTPYVAIYNIAIGTILLFLGLSFKLRGQTGHAVNSIENKILTPLKRNWKAIIVSLFTLVGFIFTGIVANQVVQPLFSGRISSIDIEPLYIQSLDNDYYAVFSVSYSIEPPLFPQFPSLGTNKLSLQLPTAPNFGSDLKLIPNFKEKSPYVNVDTVNFTNGTDVSSTKSISITLTTDGFQTKIVKSNFYMMQKLESDKFSRGNIEWSDRYWWNDLSLSPALLECSVASSSNEFVGYGKRGDRYYSFERQTFENKCPVEVRGFRPEIYKTYTTVCDKENELAQDGGNRLSFDLKPDEEKTILFIEEAREPQINNYTTIFNYTYQHESECLYAWRTYQKL